ncbi:MAG: acetate--CoA ligase family protein [Acidimicrobiia bacterium]|nr:acetate--CoA ligase family protein [Acidimicrobiia bacterium]
MTSTHTLSEADSRAVVQAAGIPVSPYVTASDRTGAVDAAGTLAPPLVAKLCGDRIAHKSERGLVRLGLDDVGQLRAAVDELLDAATPDDGAVQVLVSTMVAGRRELIAGLATDPQFGMTVMVGIGGVLAEAIADVAFRLVPLTPIDAHEMVDQLATQRLLGEFRGEPAVDRQAVADVLVGLSDLASHDPDIVSVDLNPLVIVDGRPVAVDALVERRGARR